MTDTTSTSTAAAADNNNPTITANTITTKDDDAPVFWKLDTNNGIKPTYWDDYIATRPPYDSKIFDPIISYQTAHLPPPPPPPSSSKNDSSHEKTTTALDIGTGAGSALTPLTKHFHHVIATDNDPASLAYAKSRFASVHGDKVSFVLSSGEDLRSHFPPGSIDLITCAETFPLMDTSAALDNIHALLKPGGTLAVWFYGPPFFVEPEFASACQPLLDQLLDTNFGSVINGFGEARSLSWKRAADGMASWLDYIPLNDPGKWQDVRRHKWNNSFTRLSWFTDAACDFQVERVSAVGPDETVTEEQDTGFWPREWDFEMLRRFVNASFPRPRANGQERDEVDDKMDVLFDELAQAMGGHGAKRKLSWPAVLVLASKKGQGYG